MDGLRRWVFLPAIGMLDAKLSTVMRTTQLTSLLILFLSACGIYDKKAAIYGPFNPIALGGYHSVDFGDACEGGNLTFCGSEAVDELLLFESDHPDVVALVDPQTLLPSSTIAPQMAIKALAVGGATLRARGKFSDGTEREAKLDVTVRKVTRVRLNDTCEGDRSGPFYLRCGEKVDFEVLIYDGEQPMQGHLDTLLQGQDLTPAGGGDYTRFEWKPTSCPEQTTVTSAFDPTLNALFATFGPADVETVKFDYFSDLPTYLYQPGSINLRVRPYVNGHQTCSSIAAAARTATPDVCTGPGGESEWSGDDSGSVEIRVSREGSCSLLVGAAGGALATPFSVDVFLVGTIPDEPRVSEGSDCFVEGQVICDTYRSMTLVCSKRSWKRASTCAAKQICDYLSAGSGGCAGPQDCVLCRDLATP
jgi:hypothetical protein